MTEFIDHNAGKTLLTKVHKACKEIASEKELEVIETLINEMRIIDDGITPWAIPTSCLKCLINRLPAHVQADDETQELMKLIESSSKVKKHRFNEAILAQYPDKSNRCANDLCRNVDGLKKCKKCRVFSYCSIECQRVDWKMHKPICCDTYEMRNHSI